jgi:hypothetical protein
LTRSNNEFELVQALLDKGRNDCEVSRLTRIPRSTVRDWRRGLYAVAQRSTEKAHRKCRGGHDFSTQAPGPYSYLLGMYLGDGYIARSRGVWRLRVTTDARYPGIIDECCRAMEEVLPGKRAYRLHRASRCIEVSMYSKHWVCLFPQHGPGPKHKRPIRLEPWQSGLVQRAPESFIRGLLHSDGCRVIANDRGVRSVRYHFSNRSEEIKSLLCAALDGLGVHWTRSSERQISIYPHEAVSRLDRFVGPKQ